MIVLSRHEASYKPSVRAHVRLLGSGALYNEGAEPTVDAQLKSILVCSLSIIYIKNTTTLKVQVKNNTSFYIDVLNYKLEKAGFTSALPYLVMAIVLQFSGHLADHFRSKKILTTTQVCYSNEYLKNS